MSKAIVLDANLKKSSEIELPKEYAQVNEHNLYLYIKSYLASLRSNTAQAKKRGEVSGGGKKPWAQKGGGRARAGSITSPVFVGGGVAHGPSKRNYELKINKKQKRLALECALAQKAESGKLFVVDSVAVASGKTKDAYAKFKTFNEKNVLFVSHFSDEPTFLAYRNLRECGLVDSNELNAYLVAAFRCVVIEKAVFDEITQKAPKQA
ncbi:50S ribosomal protein L4 [Helicobacter sp. MIT 00-7814]|uniref:50S ribosomal protein L4 n=1 Tax=unclassified Helicobacter TaxID=2593540 RepID=UPI000E1EB2BC|nr:MULTISPECIES: 50S ribosomal protein L4 [unclassified Helicobacter]RDU54384.1 50S ribosomal protein L4 [Helicobacter sp. MIT 99-10781]RDU54461.1 50S ribosomal protein L4 [Helicobacter sp. MIT 00-7814]